MAECMARVMEYLEDNNSWAAAQEATASIDITHYTVLNGDLYALHLAYDGAEMYRYDAETNNWGGIKSLPFVQWQSCIVTDGQFLYIIGGNTTRTSRYDSIDNKFEELACVKGRRWYAFGAALNGKIYVAGGQSSLNYSVLSSCDVYNPATNE